MAAARQRGGGATPRDHHPAAIKEKTAREQFIPPLARHTTISLAHSLLFLSGKGMVGSDGVPLRYSADAMVGGCSQDGLARDKKFSSNLLTQNGVFCQNLSKFMFLCRN